MIDQDTPRGEQAKTYCFQVLMPALMQQSFDSCCMYLDAGLVSCGPQLLDSFDCSIFVTDTFWYQ